MQSYKTATLAAAIALVSAGMVNAQLVNGDFEAGGPGPGAPGWTTFNEASTTLEYARTDGGKSFKAFGPFFFGGGAGGFQSVNVTAGSTYELGGYVFSPSNDQIRGDNFARAIFEFTDASNVVIPGTTRRADLTPADAADTWHSFSLAGTAPANAVKALITLVHVQVSEPVEGGAAFWDDVTFNLNANADARWAVDADGNYNAPASWTNQTPPNAVGASATFGGVITAPRTVTMQTAVTLGSISFNNANKYTLSGSSALTLDASLGSVAIDVANGDHDLAVPVVLADNTITTVAGGKTLSFTGGLTLAPNTSLTALGGGVTRIASTVTAQGGNAITANGAVLVADANLGAVNLTVSANGPAGEAYFNTTQRLNTLTVMGASAAFITDQPTISVVKTAALSVAGDAKLDLGDNALIVNYDGNSPFDAMRTAIQAGIAGNNIGNGIISNAAAGNSLVSIGLVEANTLSPVPTMYLNEQVDGSTVIARVTLKGDTNVDGTVNFTDLLVLAQNYTLSGTWVKGDSDYNGTVNFNDLLPVAQNYNQSFASDASSLLADNNFSLEFNSDLVLAMSMVPEPTTLSVLIGLGSLALRRRRA